MKQLRPRLTYQTDEQRREWQALIDQAKDMTPHALTLPPASGERWLVVSDVHRPFHNQVLWNKLLKLINDLGSNLHGICLAGDYLDLYTLGSYNADSLKNLSGLTLQDEYLDGLQGIDDLEQAANKGVKKLFLYGNHEDRYFRHVADKDNAKYGGALVDPIEALRLTERGWIVKTDWQSDFFTLGTHLDIVHGIYIGVHAAKTHLDRTSHSVMFGHTHRVQCFHTGNRAAFNIGGLFDINSKSFSYMNRFNRQLWANGFAIVNVDSSGCFFVEQVNVWDNRFLANGRMY